MNLRRYLNLQMCQSTPNRPPPRGVTLIELLVVISLLALLISLAAPNLGPFVAARHVQGVARSLSTDMATARSEALKRNTTVLLCVDADVTDGKCDAPTLAADWLKGWRLCVDSDGDSDCDTSTTTNPNPVRVQLALPSTVQLSGPLARLRFNADGTVTSSSYTSFTVSSLAAPTLRWTVQFAASGAMGARRTSSP